MIRKIKKNYIKLFFAISILIIIYLFNIIILRPFPFFKVDYINSINEFNASPFENHTDFYNIDLNKQFIPQRIRDILDRYNNENIYNKIKIATEITREIQENSIGKEIKSIDNIMVDKKIYYEICSESAKIFVSAMSYLNVKGRILWTNGHTVAEVWNGEKWIMTDTLSNIYALDKKENNYLSFSETVKLYPNVNFKKITNKKYSLYEYHSNKKTFQKILENNHLIFLIPNKHVFSFHTNKKKVERVLNSLNLNSPFVAKQFVGLDKKQKVGNVGIYIYKRFF